MSVNETTPINLPVLYSFSNRFGVFVEEAGLGGGIAMAEERGDGGSSIAVINGEWELRDVEEDDFDIGVAPLADDWAVAETALAAVLAAVKFVDDAEVDDSGGCTIHSL